MSFSDMMMIIENLENQDPSKILRLQKCDLLGPHLPESTENLPETHGFFYHH